MYFYIGTLIVGLVVAYFVMLKKAPKPPRVPLGPRPAKYAKQSKEMLKYGKQEGGGYIRRGSTVPDGELVCSLKAGKITTLHEAFQSARNNFGNYPCLGTRSLEADGSRGHYRWKTFMEVANKRTHLGSGLTRLGLKAGDPVGIYSKNREEWILVEQACYAFSFVIVSFYDTLGEDAVEYICNHSETKIVVCSKENTPRMLAVREKCPELTTIIQMEKLDPDQVVEADSKNIKLISFEEILKDGQAHPCEGKKPEPDNLCTIMYTSGTTGVPKGVMITHKSLIATIAGAETFLETLLTKGDAYLSYLPLAHIFERVVVNTALYRGSRVGFYQGDVRKIMDDIAELKPAFLGGVPRVYDRIYDKIQSMISQSGPFKRWLIKKALAASEESLKTGKPVWPLWDILVLSKIRAKLGGNVAAMLSGSAPLTPTVQKFLRIAFGCPVVQGYGLTETCAGATFAWLRDTELGHVGAPLPCVEIKLMDVPDMNYFAAQNTGEVAIRGPNVSLGYYKDPEKTKEDYRDGWFFTGDIGKWNKDGTLSIIDRKKNIFKLSQGEYVAAEKLEGVYNRSKFCHQVWVYGDSTKATLVAVAHPDPEALLPWAKQNGIDGDMATLCKNKRVHGELFKDLVETGKSHKLRGFEIIQRVHLVPEEFSAAQDLVTPTFKLKRPQLLKHFATQVASMYEDIEAASPLTQSSS